MLDTFLYTLSPVLMLFLFMAIGYALNKTKVLPQGSNKTIAKLETWVFCPALSFMTMANSFRIDRLGSNLTNLIFSLVLVGISIAIAIPLSTLFVKENSPERGVYQYALVFANFGYMGDPLILALFGEEVFGGYKLFTLAMTVVVYTWGISVLTPKTSGGLANSIKRLLNLPTLSMLLGMLVGITGTLQYIPEFIIDGLNSLKVCMGPVAMILAGVIIANYDLKKLLSIKKVYVASILRLIVLPCLLVTVLVGLKHLLNGVFNMNVGNEPIYYAFFASSLPLGMNTIVFPEAYGGDPEPGASMAIISSIISIITIPVLYSILSIILEVPFKTI